MSQLRTIFKKIEEDFYRYHLEGESESSFELVFSPLSTGYTYDDFLFLNTNTASEDAHKYYDELLEFAQLADTIPRKNIWTISGDTRDYVSTAYRNILWGLRLLDTDTLETEMLYEHPLFEQALKVIREEDRDPYLSFFRLYQKLVSDISELKQSLIDKNRAVVDLEIGLKEENLEKIKEQWSQQGKKEKVESKILDIIRDEFKRFLLTLSETKTQLETLKKENVGKGESFYLTSCIPNNLYKGEGLEWKQIKIDKQEIKSLLEKLKEEDFEEVFGSSDLKGLEIENISYELLFVDVTRAWFNPEILSSPFWDINILNPESISIPRFTSKLIFIRNVDVQLPIRSETNNRILQTTKVENLGPFIINAQHLRKNKNLRLHSINEGLKIDRKTVLNVSSGINANKEVNTRNLIAKKQNQFVHLAPQLRNNILQAKRVGRKPVQLKATKPIPIIQHMIQPMILKTQMIAFLAIPVNITFREVDSGETVHIISEEIKIKFQNKTINIPLSIASSGLVTGNFNKGHNYQIEVEKKGYLLFSSTFNATPKGNQNQLNLSFQLQKEAIEEEYPDTFQLIGIVAHKVGAYPNPILKADYL